MFGWLWRRLGLDFSDINFGNFGLYDPDDQSGPYIPGFEVEDTSKVLPQSKSISGTFYRWHDSARAPPVVALWSSFLDDDYKWSTPSRFAAANANCGHYFALSKNGADVEAIHYKVDCTKCKLLEIKAGFEKVLDLTTSPGRRLAFEAVVENPDASDPFIAEEMIEEVTGGTVLTQKIGYWARGQGYEAILYVAPRMIWEPELTAKDGIRPQRPWDYDLFPMYEPGFRKDLQLNLVVLRGRYLLSRIEAWQTGRGWSGNDVFGLSEEEIESQLSTIPEYAEYGEEFQEKKRQLKWLDKIRYHDR